MILKAKRIKLNLSVHRPQRHHRALDYGVNPGLQLIQPQPPAYQLGDLKWSSFSFICEVRISTISQTLCEH